MGDLVSVIVPVYGVEAYLERCMKSLLAQDHENFEIIAVDDCSPDSCGKILDTYAEKDARVRVIHREKNGGVSAARNTGLDAAKGDLIAFVDPDDFAEPDHLSNLLKTLRETGADAAACGVVNEIGGKKFPDAVEKTAVFSAREALERMCYNDHFFVTLWDKIYKKELWDGVRFPEGKLFEDTFCTCRAIARAEKVAVSPRVTYHYVTVPRSVTTRPFHKGKLDYVEAAKEMASFLRKIDPDLEQAGERKILHALFSTLSCLALLKQENEEEKKIRKGIVKEIRARQGKVFCDQKAPRRDKIAIAALSLGYPAYRAVWRFAAKRKGTV